MIITISGLIGSGKTTVCRMLGDRLGYRQVISGHVFREMAKELGMSLEEFGKLAEQDPKFDHRIDERLLNVAHGGGDLILEGRLAGQLLRRNDIPAFCIFLDAPPEVRVQRVSGREGVDLQAAIEEMRARVVEAEAEVPRAIAQAFRDGNLGIMDYYSLENIQSDTSMRGNIGRAAGQSED